MGIDDLCCMGEAARAMNKTFFTIATALAALPLAACNHAPETVDSRVPDPMASQLANAAPVELPPSMTASKSFRCDDNSLIFVDFFAGGKEVHFRKTKESTPQVLKSDAEGGPWKGGDVTISGNQSAVTYSQGGKSLTCKA